MGLKRIGSLKLPTTIDIDGTPSYTAYGGAVGWWDDQDSNLVAYVQPYKTTNGIQVLNMGSRVVKDGANVQNQLGLWVGNDGSKQVTLDQAAWRKALGINKATASGTSVFTVASGFTLTNAYITTAGPIAMFQATIKKTAAATSGTELTLGTLANTYKPAGDAAVVATARHCVSWIRNSDNQLRLTPLAAYGANTNFYVTSTFLLNSWT